MQIHLFIFLCRTDIKTYIKDHSASVQCLFFSVAKTKVHWWDGKRTMDKPLYRKQQFHPQANSDSFVKPVLSWTCRLGGGRWWVKVRLNTANLHEHSLRLPLLYYLPHASICLANCLILLLVEICWPWILYSSCFGRKSQNQDREGHFICVKYSLLFSFRFLPHPPPNHSPWKWANG